MSRAGGRQGHGGARDAAPDGEAARDLALALDVLCPMHVLIDAEGRIRHAGPTLAKLAGRAQLEGAPLLSVLDLRRPKSASTINALMSMPGAKLHFMLNCPERTELRGALAPLPDLGAPELRGGAVLNLSFGISVVEAVRDFALTGADFAATDMTVELLYLVEAKTAVMEELTRLNSRLTAAHAKAEANALTDTLTGLGNRRAMDHAFEEMKASGTGFALMHLDLDRFKEVNDTFGHAAGDFVLQETARRLSQCTREEDAVIRLGGDEFLIILPRLGDYARLAVLSRRLIQALEEPIRNGSHVYAVSASIGACFSADYPCESHALMMADADAALYAAKSAGRRGYVIHRPGPDGQADAP